MHGEAFLRRSSENSYYYAKIGNYRYYTQHGGNKTHSSVCGIDSATNFYHSRSYFVMKI